MLQLFLCSFELSYILDSVLPSCDLYQYFGYCTAALDDAVFFFSQALFDKLPSYSQMNDPLTGKKNRMTICELDG